VLACRVRVFCATKLLRAYLPPALAARLATTPPEFMPPVHYSNPLKSETTTKTLWSGGRDRCGTPWGPSTARSRPGPRGRAEQLEAARVERAVLAPWRAAIAGARLAKREALAERRAARNAKSRQRPYGASAAARTESANRPEVVAAVEARLEAARLGAVAAVNAPAVTKSENHDKDPMDRRTVRWPWGGLKGRLCGGTPLGGLLPGVTQPGTWQAVLEASNAEEARKTWRPRHAGRPSPQHGAAMNGRGQPPGQTPHRDNPRDKRRGARPTGGRL
jgi:hypothetical protein